MALNLLYHCKDEYKDWYCCTKLYCPIIDVSYTTVLNGTVSWTIALYDTEEWRLGGAIRPFNISSNKAFGVTFSHSWNIYQRHPHPTV